jgi:hypothetical protein
MNNFKKILILMIILDLLLVFYLIKLNFLENDVIITCPGNISNTSCECEEFLTNSLRNINKLEIDGIKVNFSLNLS